MYARVNQRKRNTGKNKKELVYPLVGYRNPYIGAGRLTSYAEDGAQPSFRVETLPSHSSSFVRAVFPAFLFVSVFLFIIPGGLLSEETLGKRRDSNTAEATHKGPRHYNPQAGTSKERRPAESFFCLGRDAGPVFCVRRACRDCQINKK